MMGFIHYYFWNDFGFRMQDIAAIVYSMMGVKVICKPVFFFFLSLYLQRKFFKELDYFLSTAWQQYNEYYFTNPYCVILCPAWYAWAEQHSMTNKLQ